MDVEAKIRLPRKQSEAYLEAQKMARFQYRRIFEWPKGTIDADPGVNPIKVPWDKLRSATAEAVLDFESRYLFAVGIENLVAEKVRAAVAEKEAALFLPASEAAARTAPGEESKAPASRKQGTQTGSRRVRKP